MTRSILVSLFILVHRKNASGFMKRIPKSHHPPASVSPRHQYYILPPSSLGRRKRYLEMSMKEESVSDAAPKRPVSIKPAMPLILGFSVLVCSVLLHLDGWTHLYLSMEEIKHNSSPSEFSSAVQFWLVGALSHPIIKPLFGISEVLHASPGPKVAGLVPITFMALSGIGVWSLLQFRIVRSMAGIISVAFLINSVGLGLVGQTPSLLGDYNIQLDDSYQGRVIKGCPSLGELSRNLPRNSFDYQRYQGTWYWHKVHDWTQFQEMYDTSLDIRLTESGYVNTLQIKGPSPSNSPLSWDKSPLMNGVKYSWVGSVDKTSSPGTSIESGFGVVFPNYIVDVKTNEKGDYQELIQFQCIEVGGVRLYEGIDFMSRHPEMTENELQAMHQRAHAAGLDPYGSAPEQMHRIERSTFAQPSAPPNHWQKLWDALKIERYLDQSLH